MLLPGSVTALEPASGPRQILKSLRRVGPALGVLYLIVLSAAVAANLLDAIA